MSFRQPWEAEPLLSSAWKCRVNKELLPQPPALGRPPRPGLSAASAVPRRPSASVWPALWLSLGPVLQRACILRLPHRGAGVCLLPLPGLSSHVCLSRVCAPPPRPPCRSPSFRAGRLDLECRLLGFVRLLPDSVPETERPPERRALSQPLLDAPGCPLSLPVGRAREFHSFCLVLDPVSASAEASACR